MAAEYKLSFWCKKCETMVPVAYGREKPGRFILECGHKSHKWAKSEYIPNVDSLINNDQIPVGDHRDNQEDDFINGNP